MFTHSSQPEALTRRLQDVLIGHLLAARLPRWPGADGLLLDVVLQTYPHAAASGLVPGPDELVRRHADLAGAVREFFGAGAA